MTIFLKEIRRARFLKVDCLHAEVGSILIQVSRKENQLNAKMLCFLTFGNIIIAVENQEALKNCGTLTWNGLQLESELNFVHFGACNLIKKETLAQVFFVWICEIFKNIYFFIEHLRWLLLNGFQHLAIIATGYWKSWK